MTTEGTPNLSSYKLYWVELSFRAEVGRDVELVIHQFQKEVEQKGFQSTYIKAINWEQAIEDENAFPDCSGKIQLARWIIDNHHLPPPEKALTEVINAFFDAIVNSNNDAHVMWQTLNYTDVYNGERAGNYCLIEKDGVYEGLKERLQTLV